MRRVVALVAALAALATVAEAATTEETLKKLGIGGTIAPKQKKVPEPTKVSPAVTGQKSLDEECDRLTAAEYDQDLPKSYPRVLFANIDAPKALAACEAAAAAHPDKRHYIYAYGRALAASDAGVKAREVLLKAANMGSAAAMNHIGAFYMNGYTVDVNYDTAREWLEKAAKKKSPYAMHNLGFLYMNGNGVGEDADRAAEYFIASMQAGGLVTFDDLKSHWDDYTEPVRRRIESHLVAQGYMSGGADGVGDNKTWNALDAYFRETGG